MKDKKESSQIKSESDEQYNKNISKQMKKAGDIYYFQKNYEQALIFYERAAELGCQEVQDIINNLRYKEKEEKADIQRDLNNYNSHDVKESKELTESMDTFIRTADEENSNDSLLLAAKNGDDIAQFELGELYYNGKYKNNTIKKRDLSKAFTWYEKAAKQGNSEAQLKLGMMYKYGEGVESDFDKAYKWLCESAKQKNPRALMLLGMLYLQDEHVKRNKKRAYEYLEMAAENGDNVTQGIVAYLYKSTENYSKAREWYVKSSKIIILDPCGFGELYHYGLGGEKNFEKAIELYKLAIKRGSPKAKYNLGVMFFTGTGVEQDNHKAFELWIQASEEGDEKATKAIKMIETALYEGNFEKIIEIYENDAQKEDDEAMYKLGVLFEERNKDEQDLKKAFEWYEKSAIRGNAKAQYSLACIYEKNGQDENNKQKAFSWCEKSANQGNPEAQFKLGAYYTLGITVDKNLYTAFEWLEKAAYQGHIKAQYFLAGMYRQGLGVKQDLNKATEWYKKAADQGDEDSIQVLRIMQSK